MKVRRVGWRHVLCFRDKHEQNTLLLVLERGTDLTVTEQNKNHLKSSKIYKNLIMRSFVRIFNLNSSPTSKKLLANWRRIYFLLYHNLCMVCELVSST